jgi:hypothetical protein
VRINGEGFHGFDSVVGLSLGGRNLQQLSTASDPECAGMGKNRDIASMEQASVGEDWGKSLPHTRQLKQKAPSVSRK